MSKKLLAIVIAFSMVFLASCGGGSNSDGEQSSDSEKTTISFKNYYTQGDDSAGVKAQRKMIKQFKDNHSDIKIKETSLSHDGYFKKIKTLAAGNELPDVFIAQGSMIRPFADAGLIKPLNDVLDKNKDWKNGFVEGALDTFRYQDKAYGVPFNGGPTHVIFYNKDILSKAGYDEFPSKWKDFMQMIKKLKAEGTTPIALGNKDKWILQSSYLSTLGNRYTGTEWFNKILNHEGAKFTDQEFVNALQSLQNMADKNAFNDNMNSIDNVEQRTLYYKGEAAMFIGGNWTTKGIAKNAPKDIRKSTGVAIFPTVPKQKGPENGVSGGAGGAYVINANVSAEKEKKIVKFLKSITNREAGKAVIKAGGLPIVKMKNMEQYDLSPLNKKVYNLIKESKYVPIYDAQLSPPVISVMQDGLQNLVIDKTTPEKLAKKIQKKYESEAKKD